MPRNKQKDLGQVFTPDWVVNLILDRVGYKGVSLLEKRIFEPSAGKGAFLTEIVRRYIKGAQKQKWSRKKIKQGLESCVVGVEIDKDLYQKCIDNLDSTAEKYGIKNVVWSLHNQDALSLKSDKLEFDFVVGNPPYIRVHNLDTQVRDVLKKEYDFCKKGMIDIYLAFFELGLSVLKQNGALMYITPNMFLRNSSNQDFRNYLIENRLITEMIDFGALQVFENANTYNCITQIKKNNTKISFDYFLGNNTSVKKVNTIQCADYLNKKFVFSSREDTEFIKQKQQGKTIADVATVQYGFATLRDKIYIDKNPSDKTGKLLYNNKQKHLTSFNDELVETEILYDVVKGSRMFQGNALRKTKILFPYQKVNSRWVVITEKEMKQNYPYAWKYLLKHKNELQKRDMDKGALWYEYGRSQAVQSIHNDKIIVDILVNGRINVEMVDKNTMVYSGIFIVGSRSALRKIVSELKEQDFLRYARILGKDMQGNYKSINTAIIRSYSI